MIIQDKLVGVGYCIKPGSEQDWLTYWGVCSYSLFQPKKCYTLSKLVQNTTVFLIFQMMWNAQPNTVHLLSLLAKRNDPVPTDSALPAVTHFLLASLMNTGNAKGVKLSTSANLYSLEDCKTHIHANSVPMVHVFPFVRFNASGQSPVFPIPATGENLFSFSDRCRGGQCPSLELSTVLRTSPVCERELSPAPGPHSQQSSPEPPFLHLKSKAILLISK